jgi:ferredoxin-NADP reductase
VVQCIVPMDKWISGRVVRVEQVAADMRSLFVVPERPLPHLAGQNYELRPVGYPTARMYSIVSPPTQPHELEFGVQLVPGGLVSPLLYALQPGDEIELRGPHGRLFVWPPTPGPLVLIGGGSGMAALIPIYEQQRALYPNDDVAFVMSAKTAQYVMHYEYFKGKLITRFTAHEPRMTVAFLAEHVGRFAQLPGVRCYVCGPPIEFIDDISHMLIELGFPPDSIKTERYF